MQSRSDRNLLLGRRGSVRRQDVGFCRPSFDTPPDENLGHPITYDGDAPLITIAPTGAGKTSGPVACNARTYPGQLICLDVKGDVYRLSAEHRRRMGHEVRVIDLRDRGAGSDALNPLDIARRLGTDLGAIARSLAGELVIRPNELNRDFFWVDWAETMLTAGISYMLHHQTESASLSALYDLYTGDDSAYDLAVLLDTTKDMNRTTQGGWSGYLQLPERETRPSVLGSTQAYLRLFDTDLIRRASDTTTIDLDGLVSRRPMSIYIIVPPYRLAAYAPMLRLWLSGLLHLLSTRDSVPSIPCLMMVDEAGQLGRMDSLITAMTLMRGYGMKLWTFWQAASQLDIYGSQARTIIDNAGVVQCFGIRNLRSANEIAALLGGVSGETILRLSASEQLVMVEGDAPHTCKQVRYYNDPMFEDRAEGRG
jgi:type IV secretion system protein VirD4